LCLSIASELVHHVLHSTFPFSLTPRLGVNDDIAGFHAKDPYGFAQAVHEVMVMPEEERVAIRTRARRWATTTFSQEAFERGWALSGWAQWL
jgi:hypothetical protein